MAIISMVLFGKEYSGSTSDVEDEVERDMEQAEGYRKALEQIRGGENRMFFSADWCRSIAREALSDAATAQPKSLYDIPPECICMGDGLMGMECPAKEHAKLKREPVPEAAGEANNWHAAYDSLLTSWAEARELISNLRIEQVAAQETIRQRDEHVKELREALRHYAAALARRQQGSAPPALCPTCKGTKFIKKSKQHSHGLERYPVPCPTCTDPK